MHRLLSCIFAIPPNDELSTIDFVGFWTELLAVTRLVDDDRCRMLIDETIRQSVVIIERLNLTIRIENDERTPTNVTDYFIFTNSVDFLWYVWLIGIL